MCGRGGYETEGERGVWRGNVEKEGSLEALFLWGSVKISERRKDFQEVLLGFVRSVPLLTFSETLWLIFFFYEFIYLFLAVLGLRFCARASSSCGKRGPLFIAVRGPLTIVASLVVEHRLQTRRLSNCGSRA